MNVTEFGYLILINIDFYDYPFTPHDFSLIGKIYHKHSKQCLTTFPNTSVKFRQKHFATRVIFNSLLGVWKFGQTRSFVFDIFLKMDEYNSYPVHTSVTLLC